MAALCNANMTVTEEPGELDVTVCSGSQDCCGLSKDHRSCVLISGYSVFSGRTSSAAHPGLFYSKPDTLTIASIHQHFLFNTKNFEGRTQSQANSFLLTYASSPLSRLLKIASNSWFNTSHVFRKMTTLTFDQYFSKPYSPQTPIWGHLIVKQNKKISD